MNMDWKAILESPIIQRQSYVSWEDYIRRLASESGHPSEGSIYPMFAYDEKYVLEPLMVGFVVMDGDLPLFFDHDNAMLFDDYIDYVYQFEDADTWETDAELLLYHNKAAVFDETLQGEMEEFGIKEVLLASMRGQYDGHSQWATHPDEC
tara:strand:- start:1635 stop:2084 length:450 start_codon:yes stop_codon:yes gene_type:complete